MPKSKPVSGRLTGAGALRLVSQQMLGVSVNLVGGCQIDDSSAVFRIIFFLRKLRRIKSFISFFVFLLFTRKPLKGGMLYWVKDVSRLFKWLSAICFESELAIKRIFAKKKILPA